MKTEDETSPIYIEGYIMKKEDEKKWITYWTIVRGSYIIFYTHRTPSSQQKDFFGCIKLTKTTRCIVAKRKNYSFPFYIATERARYLFKTSSNLGRHQWLSAVEQASKGKPPNISNCLRLPVEYLQEDDSETCINVLSNENIMDDDNNKDVIEEGKIRLQQFQQEEESEDTGFSISSNLVCVSSISNDQPQTTNFLDRNFMMDGEQIESVEEDIEVTDLEKTNPEKFCERLHQIYCQEEDSLTTTNKEFQSSNLFKNETMKKSGVQSFAYPVLSNPNYLSSGVTRLTKSAESLRGFSLGNNMTSMTTSGTWFNTINNSNHNIAKKNMFSRHMVSSEQDVKTKMKS